MSFVRSLVWLFLGSRLPTTSGTLACPGLNADATIRRGRWGVPMIEAGSARDAAYAIGFCQGQDRAFQLEVLQRVGRGTVAEMAGAAALPVDRLSRRIGFHRSAVEQEALLDADVRESLQGFAAGVNAGRAVGSPSPPHEFALLGVRPSPWLVADTLAVAKILSFTLCSNWGSELMRLRVLLEDGPEALAALDPAWPKWQELAAPPGASSAADHLTGALREFVAWASAGTGSNNWAVASKKTRTGRPILANDPHLDARLPSHFYLASIRCPQWAVAGAVLVGGPAVLAGHNGHCAWGLTAGLVDNTDLFIEEIGPDNASVRQGDDWVACRVMEEAIQVKGASPVTERVLITPRGPVVGPALNGAPAGLSMSATWLRPAKVRGFFSLHGVRSFAAFREEFRHWPVASQHLAYADATGEIGLQLVGEAPVRKKGHGAFPLHGRDLEAGWLAEPVPFEQMPHQQSPERGWVASANNPPQPNGAGPFLGLDFLEGYRYRSISQALEGRGDWDVASTQALQVDQRALAWEDLREHVLAAPAEGAALQGQQMLHDWDGVVSAGSPAAAVYEVWLAGMARAVAQAAAPKSWQWVLGGSLSAMTPYGFGSYRRTAHLVRVLREGAAWQATLVRVLGESVEFLKGRFGGDPKGWAWGAIRPLVMHHPAARGGGMLGAALGWLFNLGPVPCGGDADVINQAAALPLNPLAPADNIPAMRMVVDVGAWQNSRWVLPGGQSGNPMSPHYGDLLPLWQRGEGIPIAYTPEEVAAATVEELKLRPQGR